MKQILFSTENVQAILDGRKTVTRRPANINIEVPCIIGDDDSGDHAFDWDNFDGGEATGFVCRHCGFGVSPPHSRYPVGTSAFRPRFLPGDILYVRETWCSAYDGEKYFFLADKNTSREEKRLMDYDDVRWHPSIHMPKEAARLFLRVKSVRVERLQDITVDGVSAEGIDNEKPCEDSEFICNYCPLPDELKGVHCYGGMPVMCEGKFCNEAMECWQEEYVWEFEKLWNNTIKPADLSSFGWEANPWVFVIEFERITREEAYHGLQGDC